MTYRAEFEGAALVQLNGLPPAVFDALVERVVALVQEPWDAVLLAPGEALRLLSRATESVAERAGEKT